MKLNKDNLIDLLKYVDQENLFIRPSTYNDIVDEFIASRKPIKFKVVEDKDLIGED